MHRRRAVLGRVRGTGSPSGPTPRRTRRASTSGPRSAPAGRRRRRGRRRCGAAARPRSRPASAPARAREQCGHSLEGAAERPFPDARVRQVASAGDAKAAVCQPRRGSPGAGRVAPSTRHAPCASCSTQRHPGVRCEGVPRRSRRRHRQGGEDIARHLLPLLRQQGDLVPRCALDVAEEMSGLVDSIGELTPDEAGYDMLRDWLALFATAPAIRSRHPCLDRGRDRHERVRPPRYRPARWPHHRARRPHCGQPRGPYRSLSSRRSPSWPWSKRADYARYDRPKSTAATASPTHWPRSRSLRCSAIPVAVIR